MYPEHVSEQQSREVYPAMRAFAPAWSHVDAATEARRSLARCWKELCDRDPFDSNVVPLSESRGRLDVLVDWPPDLARQADDVAALFAASIKAVFDDALLAAATATTGAIETPDPDDYRMPLCVEREECLGRLDKGKLVGLRPDQVQTVWSLQPFVLANRRDHPTMRRIGRAMAHLAGLLAPQPHARSRVAVWAHSSEPRFESIDPGGEVAGVPLGDGLLERRLPVAEFTCAGVRPDRVRTNPMIAFDLIFNAPPYPSDPDDNLMTRSALLLATAKEFIRGMERSVDVSRVAGRSSFGSLVPVLDGAPWGEVDLSSTENGAEIDEVLRNSDLGIGTYYDPEGNVTILLRAADRTFGRPIPSPLALDPATEVGAAAEEASREAASLWGLPDFVLSPKVLKKSEALREIGDCTVVVGSRALAVQVKHRTPQGTDDHEVEVRRIQKRVRKAAAQAAGSIRSLAGSQVDLVNARGRAIPITGSDLEWCRVVVIDHPNAPDGIVVRGEDNGSLPLVVLLRRDWDFLFDQLRSTSAVIDYLFRVAGDESHDLGHEPARYFELAKADDEAVEVDGPAEWTKFLDVPTFSHPILPTIPASNMDEAGATVYRLILEDIAETQFEREEADRLKILSMLDMYPVCERAELGRLLLTHLDDVAATTTGVKWQFRRTILDDGYLQLAFGACSSFSELHREAFGQWAMLRHHEFSQLREPDDSHEHRTVAVLLTPREDRVRLWDTTSFTLFGDLGHSEEEIARMRSLWNDRHAA